MKRIIFAGLCLGFAATGCGDGRVEQDKSSSSTGRGLLPQTQSKSPQVGAEEKQIAGELGLASSRDVSCPAGFNYLESHHMCVTLTQALGPFSPEMVAKCQKFGGGSSCAGELWGLQFAKNLRGTGVCQPGTTLDSDRGECVEGENVYGPFTKETVRRCVSNGGGKPCESMRLHISFAPPLQGTANRELLAYYSLKGNYDKVYRDVLSFYPEGRSNGCVAFMSSALRATGTFVPKDRSINGENISLVTLPFSIYLQKTLGWKVITNSNDLEPGDVVFTEDEPKWPGYPAHTYMFHSWKDKSRGIGNVIDNQAFIHERNIFGFGTFNFTPFDYALRSPK